MPLLISLGQQQSMDNDMMSEQQSMDNDMMSNKGQQQYEPRTGISFTTEHHSMNPQQLSTPSTVRSVFRAQTDSATPDMAMNHIKVSNRTPETAQRYKFVTT